MVILQLSMSIATMEEEVVGATEIKSGHESNFQNIITHSFEFPEAYSYFKTGSLFIGLMWLFTGISEGKILFQARSM